MAKFLYVHDPHLEHDASAHNWGFGIHGNAHLAISTYDLADSLGQTVSALSHLAVLPLLRMVKVGPARFKEVADRAKASPDSSHCVGDVMREEALYKGGVLGDHDGALHTVEALLRARYGIGDATKASIALDLQAQRKILLLAAYAGSLPNKPPNRWIGKVPLIGSHFVNAMIDRELGL